METAAQERKMVQLMQGRHQAWPFHMMGTTGCLLDAYCTDYSSDRNGDCFALGWEEQPATTPLGCFGFDIQELSPLFVDESSLLPACDAVAVPENLDDLLLSFWDASCHDAADVGSQAAFNSSCCLPLQHETSSGSSATTTTTNSLFSSDDCDDPLSSIFPTGPVAAEKALLQAPPAAVEPPSSSSSNCHADPRGSPSDGAQVQCTAATQRAPPPLPPRGSSSSTLKRSTREELDQAESSQLSGGKRRKASPAGGVVCPFALLKPDGLDGGATLADINARILMRPSRPVRHPVGEFACAPRVSADLPGISGKAVSSFTRLHTPGRGTITIIRTRG